MKGIIVQTLTALMSSLGFSLTYRLRRRLLLPAAVGGLCGRFIYLFCAWRMAGVFTPCLAASAVSALYAEIMARVFKAPVTVFFLPAVVPLIPGSSLYYAMSAAVRGDWSAARSYGALTVMYSLAISAGMSLVWAASVMLARTRHLLRNR